MERWDNKASEFNQSRHASKQDTTAGVTYQNPPSSTGIPSYSETYPKTPRTEYGWVCPQCGRVYSPWTSMCLYCGGGSWTITCGPQTICKSDSTTVTAKTVPGTLTTATNTDDILHKAYVYTGPAPEVHLTN